jgi:protein-tyrosine phosphatase
MIDFHNHVIPGVDDGAADVEQARAALLEMKGQGIETVVATPHLNGSATADPEMLVRCLDALDQGWEALQNDGAVPGIRLLRGAEVMLDTPAPVFTDPRTRLAGTNFVLVEFPFMTVPPYGATALFEMKMQGWQPVLAHPERYANAHADLSDAVEWSRVGALLQVNSGSLLGKYGDQAKRISWDLLAQGLVSYLSSDYHARGRCHTAAAREMLRERGAEEQAILLTEVNPRRLLDGQPPLPVPPIERPRPLWRRILGR